MPSVTCAPSGASVLARACGRYFSTEQLRDSQRGVQLMRVNCWRTTAASLPGSCRALLAVIAFTAPFATGAQNPNKSERIAPFSALYVTTGTMLMDVSQLNP